jgi:hypothetical protein
LDEYMNCQKVRCTSKARKNWQNPGVAFLFLFVLVTDCPDDSTPAITHWLVLS